MIHKIIFSSKHEHGITFYHAPIESLYCPQVGHNLKGQLKDENKLILRIEQVIWDFSKSEFHCILIPWSATKLPLEELKEIYGPNWTCDNKDTPDIFVITKVNEENQYLYWGNKGSMSLKKEDNYKNSIFTFPTLQLAVTCLKRLIDMHPPGFSNCKIEKYSDFVNTNNEECYIAIAENSNYFDEEGHTTSDKKCAKIFKTVEEAKEKHKNLLAVHSIYKMAKKEISTDKYGIIYIDCKKLTFLSISGFSTPNLHDMRIFSSKEEAIQKAKSIIHSLRIATTDEIIKEYTDHMKKFFAPTSEEWAICRNGYFMDSSQHWISDKSNALKFPTENDAINFISANKAVKL